MLTIHKSTQNRAAVFALEGRLDSLTAPELESAIQEALPALTELTLDLEKLEYISSAGLRIFLSVQKLMHKQGKMKVCNAKEPIMEIFDLTGFSDILNIE